MSFFDVIIIFSFLQSFANKMENLWNIIGMHTNMALNDPVLDNRLMYSYPILTFTTAKRAVTHSPVLQDGLCLLVYCILSSNILNVKTVFKLPHKEWIQSYLASFEMTPY